MEYSWEKIKKYGKRATIGLGIAAALGSGIYFSDLDSRIRKVINPESKFCNMAREEFKEASRANTPEEFMSLVIDAEYDRQRCVSDESEKNRDYDFEYPEEIKDVDQEMFRESVCRESKDLQDKRSNSFVSYPGDIVRDRILRDRSKALKNICYIGFPVEEYSTWEDVLGGEENGILG
ncbi:MAG: hypothetical protein ABEK17_02710 [Candidatus Aenigmatarchaeota archaeon]